MNALIHTPCGLIYGTAEIDQDYSLVEVTFGTDQEIYNMGFGRMHPYSKGTKVFFDPEDVKVQPI